MRPLRVLAVLASAAVLAGCPQQPAPRDAKREEAGMSPRARATSPAAIVPLPGPDMRTLVAAALRGKSAPAAGGASHSAPRDFDLDRRSDIVWHNVNSGELYYWLMGPNGVVGENGGAHLPVGHTALGTGDFNGDGRADVVSASSGEVRIALAFGWTFATSQLVAARPPGVWTLAGITDINGDGKSDLVWHHRGSGELYYWLMDGAAIFAGQGGAYLPAGYTALGGGDFDGDGRGDILSASPSEVRISFGPRAGTGWIIGEPMLVQSRPPSQWRFGGTGDLDGDGRTDVLWHNTATREVYSWLMSGTSIAGGQGGTFLPERGRTVATGDVDGDARADLVFMGEGDIRVAAARTDGGFGAPKTVGRVPFAGWKLVDDVDKPRAAIRGDVDGDGKADMLFFNSVSRELYAWVLDGATKIKEQGGTSLPAGFAPLSTGDFNGDGRVDVLSTDGGELRLSLARPDGGFIASVRVADRPVAKWAFGGLGDFDADGRVDILWFDTEKNELYAWLMSSANVVGGKGGNAFVPAGHQVQGVGDIDGDGMADVITRKRLEAGIDGPRYETNVSYALVTGTFGPSTFVCGCGGGRFGPGYALYDRGFVGISDLNGDGRDDVVFQTSHDSGIDYLSWDGAAFKFLGYGAYPYALLGFYDTDGDSRGDLLYLQGSDVWNVLPVQRDGYVSMTPYRVETLPPSP